METAEAERAKVVTSLSKNKFGKVDEFSVRSLEKSYDAHAMAADSAVMYNFEQEQICRETGTHPNQWRINDDGGYSDDHMSHAGSSRESDSTSANEGDKNLQRRDPQRMNSKMKHFLSRFKKFTRFFVLNFIQIQTIIIYVNTNKGS